MGFQVTGLMHLSYFFFAIQDLLFLYVTNWSIFFFQNSSKWCTQSDKPKRCNNIYFNLSQANTTFNCEPPQHKRGWSKMLTPQRLSNYCLFIKQDGDRKWANNVVMYKQNKYWPITLEQQPGMTLFGLKRLIGYKYWNMYIFGSLIHLTRILANKLYFP